MTPEQYSAAWSRRPSSAVSRLGGRQLLVLSARDLCQAAVREKVLLVALVAPAPAALSGFARAARDAHAPLVLVRPSAAGGEKGPEEARDDSAFVEAALKAAEEAQFGGPIALCKDPPRNAEPDREHERLEREIDAGFTGLAVAVEPGGERDAGSAAAHVCQLELGLELVPSAASADEAMAVARELKSRGAAPSAVRITGYEHLCAAARRAADAAAFSTASDAGHAHLLGQGVNLLVAGSPFLRAVRRAASGELWDKLATWAREHGASLEQAAARHQRQLRDLPPAAQEKLEALAHYEAAELFESAGAHGSAARLLAHVGQMAP